MNFDISNLQQPGVLAGTVNAAAQGDPSANPMSAPNQPAPPDAVMTPAMAAPDVTDRSINPQQPPAPPAGGTSVGTPTPQPHAKLLAMIQGLSVGLGAAAKSIATHGREGGAEEVQRFQGEEQRQKESAAAAISAQKNAALQQTIMQGTINKQNQESYMFGSTFQDNVAKSHFDAKLAQQSVTAGATAEDTHAQVLLDQGYMAPGYTADPSTGQAVRIQGQPTGAIAAPAAAGATPNVLPGVTPGSSAAAPVAGAPKAGAPAAAVSAIPREGQYFLRQQAVVNEGIKVLTAANGGKTTPLIDAVTKIFAERRTQKMEAQK